MSHPGISPLNHLSDGEPKEIGTELKTNYRSMAKRYELAERQVWSITPDWKREVIINCRINETDDRIYREYAKSIYLLAEDESIKLDDDLPAVPETPRATKIAEPTII